MQIGWPLATKSALLTLLMAVGSMAAAQTGRPGSTLLRGLEGAVPGS